MAVPRRSRYEEVDRWRSSRPWSWLLAGILIGIIFSVFIYMQLILPRTVQPIPATATVDASPVVLAETETSPSAAEKTVVSADKPSDKTETTPTKTTPRFEFYTVLPDQEVNVNNTSPRPLPLGTNPELQAGEVAALAVGTAPITTPGTYLLQVGSFRDVREAEGLKSHLTSLGITAHIERATLSNSNDVWHRVRLGPFNDLDRLNQTRARLTQHNITAIVVQF
jgi:cell division protein FtsN